MITISNIGWGNYGGFEGPFYRGKIKFYLSSNPDFLELCFAVLGATEGGCYDSLNFYDRCVCTGGIIQHCNVAPIFGVDNMLGLVAERCGIDYLLQTLKPALDASNSTFKQNVQGKWRFHFLDERGEVNTADKQKQLFWRGTGLKGSWTEENKLYAKQWAACMANVWINEEAQRAQVDYTKPKLLSFVMKDAKTILFDDGDATNPWVLATRAAFISFAANLPLNANKSLLQAVKESKYEKWTPEWCYDVLHYLTYAPNIAIYPIRYNAIRPVLEKFWGVTLPKNAEELKKRSWLTTPVVVVVTESTPVIVEEEKPVQSPTVDETKPADVVVSPDPAVELPSEEPVKPEVSLAPPHANDSKKKSSSQTGLWSLLAQLLQFVLKLFKR